MKTNPVSSRLYGILILFEMHTDFLIRALNGINEEDAQKRLDTKANHIAWITGSMVYGRYYLAKSFGIELNSVTDELFKDNRGIIDDANYPTLNRLKKDWNKISPMLHEVLINATEEKLDEAYKVPGMEITLFEMISFSTYRDANCIGQIALWRRLLGYSGMNYM
ncbi:DinB family protein [Pedobacter fastidiosus]|uniref:DinB family protein n=1 Tax=Pedobacter fastidiosus TaxID=2765361 RepID=A0ABR7KRR9_9SPHI|nr:DinB family protein [Pedobacter fastidiosus]MBC6110793.1 DinB family protein [Pedobacter fastidiosus]